MARKQFVLFDFDGVIADSFHIAHAVAKKTCVYYTEHQYRKQFEGNVFEATKLRLADDHGDKCDHALDWWAEFTPRFKTHVRPFAGMIELVMQLSQTYTLCIVSSSQNELIKHFLEQHELSDAIDGLYGADVNPRKDEKFKMIFEKYGIGAENCVFVTDTLGDINEAANVSITSIGVTWGFQDKETLLRGNPFMVVELPSELPSAVAGYFVSK